MWDPLSGRHEGAEMHTSRWALAYTAMRMSAHGEKQGPSLEEHL